MKKLAGIILTVVAAAMTPIVAHAIPITVTATGHVTSSGDANNFFGLGSGLDTLLGASITATWWFDTDDLGPDAVPGTPHIVNYAPYTDMMESTFFIDTDTVDSNFVLSELVEVTTIDNPSLSIQDAAADGSPDLYQISDRRNFSSPVKRTASGAILITEVSDLITSLLPSQSFTWNSTDFTGDLAQGIFSYVDSAAATRQITEVRYDIDTFVVSAGSVPEPSALILLTLSLLGLSLKQRKTRS